MVQTSSTVRSSPTATLVSSGGFCEDGSMVQLAEAVALLDIEMSTGP
jgi:hypothetical protein